MSDDRIRAARERAIEEVERRIEALDQLHERVRQRALDAGDSEERADEIAANTTRGFRVHYQQRIDALRGGALDSEITTLSPLIAHRHAGDIAKIAPAALGPILTGAPPPPLPVECETCRDGRYVTYIRRDLRGREYRETRICPRCGAYYARKRLEAAWPMTPRVKAMTGKKLRPLGDPAVKEMVAAARDLRAHWRIWHKTPPEERVYPTLFLAGVEKGAFGTGKTHLLARLHEAAWEDGMTAIYTDGPTLVDRFTTFSKHLYTDPETGLEKELPGAQTHRAAIMDLSRVDVLLIDEAHRIPNKGGDGWSENQLQRIIDGAAGIVVVATNSLKGLPPAIQDRAYDTAAGAQLIVLDDTPSFRRRPDRPTRPAWRTSQQESDDE